jgi:glutamate-1-semialdehyde 2,1-aminomutase
VVLGGDLVSVPTGDVVEQEFRGRTPASAELMRRAETVMPGGATRGFGYHRPYPIVADRAAGPYLYDVDGHRYVDLVYNGLSLIHGHAYPPVTDAVRHAARRGSGWLVSSREQIAFAEQLCDRVEAFDLVRFTNSGTEAGMLAVKIARAATARPAIIKARGGYHGSYDDLEVGLAGRGEIPGRAYLGDFGDASSFESVLERHGDEIAAVVLEPLQYTGNVTNPDPEFLRRVQAATRQAGALFVLDDCLMMRLAPGGSAEKYGLAPDITFLGKFIGGGHPMGVVGGRHDVLSVLDPRREDHLYHGGSFNGNLLACIAGAVSLSDLTKDRIAVMDAAASDLRAHLARSAAELDVPLITVGDGSAGCIYLQDHAPRPTEPREDSHAIRTLHLAALTHGVFLGPGGEFAMATTLDDTALAEAEAGLDAALADVAAELDRAAS